MRKYLRLAIKQKAFRDYSYIIPVWYFIGTGARPRITPLVDWLRNNSNIHYWVVKKRGGNWDKWKPIKGLLYSPAHIVGLADSHLCKAAGLLRAFIRAAGYNGLSATFCTCCVCTRTEEQLVCVVRGNPVKEPAQSLIAFGPVAQAWLGSGFDTSWDIFCAKLLAQVVHITSLSCIQASVHGRHANLRVCGCEKGWR